LTQQGDATHGHPFSMFMSTFSSTPWTGIDPSQGLCLQRTAQFTEATCISLSASRGIQSHDPNVRGVR
jgi:hypothetical protein